MSLRDDGYVVLPQLLSSAAVLAVPRYDGPRVDLPLNRTPPAPAL